MIKYDERIKQIKDDRIKMLEMVKYNITENKEHLSDSLDNVMKILYLEEENTKKYEALIKAQNIIIDLTQKILSTEKVDEVINLRKKINYYINKIKNELKKRNVSDDVVYNYKKNIENIRKNYSKYLRYLKRKDNIDSIDNLYSKYLDLTDLEKKELQRLVRNEKRYSKRNITFFNDFFSDYTCSNDDKKQVNELSKNIELEDISSCTKKDDDNKIIIKHIDVNSDDNLDDNESSFNIKIVRNRSSNDDYNSLTEDDYDKALSYLNDKAEDYKNKYGIVDTIDYCFSRRKNIIRFLKNIRNNIVNTKMAKKMYSDFYGFYSGNDMISFYEYTIKRNSIKHGLKAILSPSRLYKKEDIYLRKREDCIDWLYDFCKKNTLNFFVPKEYVKN